MSHENKMRYINTQTLQMRPFERQEMESPYAILSSYWETKDATFDMLRTGTNNLSIPAISKLESACLKAQSQGISWLWASNSCVNRLDNGELTESINCSTQIFKNSAVCLVYLHDLDVSKEPSDGWAMELQSCKWFRRVWTLHEVIFAGRIQFYNREWTMIGTKDSLLSPLSTITGIDKPILQDPRRLMDVSVGYKMSWAASLTATYAEDVAYSLISIFGIRLSIIYGEGERAFLRLQDEIAKTTDDGTLLAWQSNGNQLYRGIFAKFPSEFSYMSYSYKTPLRIKGSTQTTEEGIYVNDVFTAYQAGEGIVLAMWPDQNQHQMPGLGIILSEQNGRYVRYMPHRTIDMYQQPIGLAKEICLERGLQHCTFEHRIKTLDPFFPKIGEKDTSIGYYPGHGERDETTGHPLADTFSGFSSRLCPPSFANKDMEMTTQDSVSQKPNAGSVMGCRERLIGRPKYSNSVNLESLPDSIDIRLRIVDDSVSYDSENEGLEYYNDENESELVSNSTEQFDDCSDPVANVKTTNLPQNEDICRNITLLKEFGLERFFSWVVETQSHCEKARDCSTLYQLQKQRQSNRSIQRLSLDSAIESVNDENSVVKVHSCVQKVFACPFYLQNPTKHRSCLETTNLLCIKDVINHIRSSHRLPYYCPICGDVFCKDVERDMHILARTCSTSVLPEFDGALYSQIQQISHDLSPLHTRDVQWYDIWDILFPCQKQPDELYLLKEVDHIVCLMKDFWSSRGFEIVSDFLKDTPLQPLVAERPTLKSICASVLDHMIHAIIK